MRVLQDLPQVSARCVLNPRVGHLRWSNALNLVSMANLGLDVLASAISPGVCEKVPCWSCLCPGLKRELQVDGPGLALSVQPVQGEPLSEEVKAALLQVPHKKRLVSCGSEFLKYTYVAHGLTDSACSKLCGERRWWHRIIVDRTPGTLFNHFLDNHGLPRGMKRAGKEVRQPPSTCACKRSPASLTCVCT